MHVSKRSLGLEVEGSAQGVHQHWEQNPFPTPESVQTAAPTVRSTPHSSSPPFKGESARAGAQGADTYNPHSPLPYGLTFPCRPGFYSHLCL